jgi:uncharacterized protein
MSGGTIRGQSNIGRQRVKKVANTLTNKEKVCYYRWFSGFSQLMNAFAIDGFDFCRRGEHREGEIAIADLGRLSADLVGSNGALRWSLQGAVDRQGHSRLSLSVAAQVQLRCQRCLTPIPHQIDSHSVLVLAADEGSADELEELLEAEEVEVIVGSRTLDVLVLIEDEALLALPLSPRHTVCPDQSLPEMGKSDKPESPFSVLKNLKKN